MKTFDDDVTDILINLDFQITVTPDNESTSKHIIKAKQALKEAIDKHIIGVDRPYMKYEPCPSGCHAQYSCACDSAELRVKNEQRLALWGKEGEENDRRTS